LKILEERGTGPSLFLRIVDYEFLDDSHWVRSLFEEIASRDRFILSISDATPPDAKFERLLRITEMAQKQGEITIEKLKVNS
jgi:hypothetical protein